MTRRGLGFTIVAVLVYLAANQTRIGWLYLIASFMLAVLGVAWILPRLWTRGLSVMRTITTPVHEGDEALIALRLTKRGFASHFTLVRDGSRAFLIPRIDSNGASVSYGLNEKRGRHTLPSPVAENSGLLGLFKATLVAQAPRLQLTVYPWYLPEAQWQARRRRPAFMLGADRPGTGTDLLGTREYRPGDPSRHIHWRSSARRNVLVVKEFEEERNPGLALVLDTSRELGVGRDTTLEYSIRLAATLARYAAATARPFRLITYPQPREAQTWRATLEFLTDLKQDSNAPLLPALVSRLAPGEQAVVASPNLGSASEALAAHHRRGAAVLAIRLVGFGNNEPAGVPAVDWPKGADPAGVIREILSAL